MSWGEIEPGRRGLGAGPEVARGGAESCRRRAGALPWRSAGVQAERIPLSDNTLYVSGSVFCERSWDKNLLLWESMGILSGASSPLWTDGHGPASQFWRERPVGGSSFGEEEEL